MEGDFPSSLFLHFFFFFVFVVFVLLGFEFPFRYRVDGCEGDDVEGWSALLTLDDGRRGLGLLLDDGGRSPRLWWWGGL